MYLWFLVSLPLLVLTHLFTLKYIETGLFRFANFEAISRITKGKGRRFGVPYAGKLVNQDFWILVRRSIILVLLVLSIAGTVVMYTGYSSNSDFVIALDNSQSMLGDDFMPTRFDAAKQTAVDFVDKIPKGNEIGLVTFSSTTFINLMLTNNHNDVKNAIKNVDIVAASGTAIGDAIVSSVNLLLTKTKEKTIILITDGQTNVGIPIEDALAYAKSNGVSVSTIGLATKQGVELFGLDLVSDIDEEELQYIASETRGKYAKATSAEELKNILDTIGIKVKTNVTVNLAPYLLLISLLMLFVEWGIINVKYKTIG